MGHLCYDININIYSALDEQILLEKEIEKMKSFKFIPMLLILAIVFSFATSPVKRAYAGDPNTTPTPEPTPTANEKAVQEVIEKLNEGGNGMFDELGNEVTGALSNVFSWVRTVGLILLLLAGVIAAIMLGVMKNEQAIQKNKTWLIRILGAAAGIGLIMTLIPIFASLGDKM